MADTPFYRPITNELCQGDIFERVPLVYINDNPCLLKKTTLPGKREGFELGDPLSLAAPPRAGTPLLVPAPCDYTRALLLTFDCEIDKPSAKILTLALIRPLDLKMSENDINTIRENRKFAFFHLPPEQDGAFESHVDFRRVGTVGIDLVRAAPRVSRLSDTARKAMLFQYFRYLTRIDLYKASLPPPQEEAEG
jgi:hypothetical protein